MTCALTFSQYNNHYLLFNNRIKNNVVENSNFIGINYSPNYVTMNNIAFMFTIEQNTIETYFNKYKCDFKSTSHNQSVVEQICMIEKNILNKYKPYTNSQPCYKLLDQLSINNRIKISHFHNVKIENGSNKKTQFLLKVSGLWENKDEYGIIYKFYLI